MKLLAHVIVLSFSVGVAAFAENSAVWWNVSAANITDLHNCPAANCLNYEAQALVFTLQGLVNREGPRLLFDLSSANVDFPLSDLTWKTYFETQRNISFETLEPQVCILVDHFTAAFGGKVVYTSDGFSLFLAMTISGLNNLLPVSAQLMQRFPCLSALPTLDRVPAFADKLTAFAWGASTLLPNCSKSLVYNADYFSTTDNGAFTLMSVDYPIMNKAFVMNLLPCWFMVDQPPCNSSQIQETQLFMDILKTRDNLVSVWGWSDPEHAYTNATTHAGGAVFCTFSTSNLAFWSALGIARGTVGLPMPQREPAVPLDADTVYITFETNEGDTPRILTAQFTSQWLSPHRGSVPVAWAVDPLLAEFFPELWNYYATSATVNDTFLAGVDGAGYVYVHSLGDNARAYEQRASHYMKKFNLGVVDVGVANADYPAVTLAEMAEYVRNSDNAVSAFVNACGSCWEQPVNTWLVDGTPVINSVCNGPGQEGNYLFYYRDTLDPTAPAADLAGRIRWATSQYAVPGYPFFVLAFGGLGVYGGYGDFFLFLKSVMADLAVGAATGADPSLQRKFVVVGAHEMARLARLAAPKQD